MKVALGKWLLDCAEELSANATDELLGDAQAFAAVASVAVQQCPGWAPARHALAKCEKEILRLEYEVVAQKLSRAIDMFEIGSDRDVAPLQEGWSGVQKLQAARKLQAPLIERIGSGIETIQCHMVSLLDNCVQKKTLLSAEDCTQSCRLIDVGTGMTEVVRG